MEALLGLVAALVLGGPLAEYLVHCWLHGWLLRTPLGRFHAEHHRMGVAKPLWQELLLYQPVALALAPLGGLLGLEFFCGWWSGGMAYAALVGCVHWREHRRCGAFHAYHHRYPNRNMGVVTRFWDWALGTLGADDGIQGSDAVGASATQSPDETFGNHTHTRP